MEVCTRKENLSMCTCTAHGGTCENRGKCCDCVKFHRDQGCIPGCFFSEEGEKLYDRSMKTFVKTWIAENGMPD